MKKHYLLLEFATLFIILPTAILFLNLHKFFILILWTFALACFSYLKKDKDFDQKNFLNKNGLTKNNFLKILVIFSFSTLILTCYTYFYEQPRFLSFPREMPVLWLAVMVLYPLLSVYPQEIIYRAFFMHRYKNIFKSEKLILIISAISFGYAHVIFSNFIAVFLSSFGGLLFGLNYQKNKSLLLVSIEHALYGCMIFTIGLGWYFYHGAN